MTAPTMQTMQTTLTREMLRLERIGELPLSPFDQSKQDLARALKAVQDARPEYERAEKYYRAKNPELFGHPRVERALARTKDRYKLNFAKLPVDALVERLKISSVIVRTTTADDEDATSTTTPTQNRNIKENDLSKRFRREVWKHLKLRRKTRELHKWVGIYGDAYWFIWPQLNNDNSDTPTPGIFYNSPLTTRVIYSQDEPDVPQYAIKCWARDKIKYAILYYPSQIEYYVQRSTATDQQLEDGSGWDLYDVVENPFDMLPIFHFRNGDPYGTPEHIDAYGPQDAVNKLSTTLVHTSEYQGFPQRFQLTDPNSELGGDSNDNDGWDDETSHSDRANEVNDNDAANESGPGVILNLKAKAAGQFQAADADGFLKPLDFYIRSMSQLTTTPLRYFDPMPSRPNGEAARADDAPFVEKVKTRQDYYEDTYAEAFAFAFCILTDEDPTEHPFDVDVRWTPAVSIEDALGWDTVKRKIEAGVPRRIALIEAGYPVDQVDSWLQNNEDKMTLNADIRTLETLSLAVRNLSGAPTLIHAETLGAALAKVLTRLLGEKVEAPANQPQPPTNPNPNQLGLPPTTQPTPPNPTTNDDRRTATGADDISEQRNRSGN